VSGPGLLPNPGVGASRVPHEFSEAAEDRCQVAVLVHLEQLPFVEPVRPDVCGEQPTEILETGVIQSGRFIHVLCSLVHPLWPVERANEAEAMEGLVESESLGTELISTQE